MNEFQVKHGLDTNLPSLKDTNTLYHTTDTKRTFIGDKELQNRLLDNYVISTLEDDKLLITSADTVEEAFGKVEASIINNEQVVAQSFIEVNDSCGFDENGEYVIPTGDTILSATTSLTNADITLSTVINEIAVTIPSAATASNQLTDKLYVDDALSKFATEHTVRIINMTESAATIVPNTFYIWGEIAELDITLATPEDTTIYNEYMFQFTSGDEATTLILPEGITWYLGNNTILANKTYQISILNNLAVLGEF